MEKKESEVKRLREILSDMHDVCDVQDCCAECPIGEEMNCEMFNVHPICWDEDIIDDVIDFILYLAKRRKDEKNSL